MLGAARPAQASRLLRDVKIQQALNVVRDRLAERIEQSIEGVLQELIENVAEARAAGQYSSAVRGLGLIGKHLGMFDRQRESRSEAGHMRTTICSVYRIRKRVC